MKRNIFFALLIVVLFSVPVLADVLSDITHGILTCPASTDIVSHWSMKKGDMGGGAGVGLVSVPAWKLTAEGTAVGYQTRQTLGVDLITPLQSDIFDPLVKGLNVGLFAGWNYQANVQENYTDLKWLGFDWGISIVKKF